MKNITNNFHSKILLIVAILFVLNPLNADYAEKVSKLSCEEKVKHIEQSLIEYENELSQVKKELNEERKVRRKLQDQLDALTELEENINERETLNNNNL